MAKQRHMVMYLPVVFRTWWWRMVGGCRKLLVLVLLLLLSEERRRLSRKIEIFLTGAEYCGSQRAEEGSHNSLVYIVGDPRPQRPRQDESDGDLYSTTTLY